MPLYVVDLTPTFVNQFDLQFALLLFPATFISAHCHSLALPFLLPVKIVSRTFHQCCNGIMPPSLENEMRTKEDVGAEQIRNKVHIVSATDDYAPVAAANVDNSVEVQSGEGAIAAEGFMMQTLASKIEALHSTVTQHNAAHVQSMSRIEQSIADCRECLQFQTGRIDIMGELVRIQGINFETLEARHENLSVMYEKLKGDLESLVAVQEKWMRDALNVLEASDKNVGRILRSMDESISLHKAQQVRNSRLNWQLTEMTNAVRDTSANTDTDPGSIPLPGRRTALAGRYSSFWLRRAGFVWFVPVVGFVLGLVAVAFCGDECQNLTIRNWVTGEE